MSRAHVVPWRESPDLPTGPNTAASDRGAWTALLERIATGDTDACVELYDRSATPVFSLIAHILGDRAAAEDTVRDVYVDVLDRARRGEHRNHDPIAWVLSLARSAAITRLRSNPRAGFGSSSETVLRDAHPALSALSDEQRTILQLLYSRGLTVREAALRLGRPVQHVTTQVHAALTLLRTMPPARGPHRRTPSGRYRVVTSLDSSPSPTP